jgi:hypothetical protein
MVYIQDVLGDRDTEMIEKGLDESEDDGPRDADIS